VIALLGLLACVGSIEPAAPLPEQTSTQGRYRVAVDRSGDRLRLRVRLADGSPVEHGTVRLTGRMGDRVLTPLVDPGECDDIGPERCFHPGGWYVVEPVQTPPDTWSVRISGPAGVDQLSL
jgi:hypothetical protein